MGAAGRCSLSNCRKYLVLKKGTNCDKTKQIGIIAHIVAHSSNGPRSDPNYPKDKLDTYNNWILLCPTCHEIVDKQEKKYTANRLLKIKNDHELWVHKQLDNGMSKVSFAELEIAAKAIASGKYFNHGDFQVITPEEKIRKNGLTNCSRMLITMGLSKSGEVKRFIVKMAQIDDNYPERLKSGFLVKYDKLKITTSGDALFTAMLEFAQAGQDSFTLRAASLAILSHLFHLCEVFEK